MNITRKGTDKVFKQECRGCHSDFTYTAGEVETRKFRNFDGKEEERKLLVCPACGYELDPYYEEQERTATASAKHYSTTIRG